MDDLSQSFHAVFAAALHGPAIAVGVVVGVALYFAVADLLRSRRR
jgi:uncharacterized membrane protein